MAYPGPHFLLAFGGPLFTGEEWSCSLRSTPNFGDGESDGSGSLPDIVAAMAAWWDSQTAIAGAARLGWVKYNRIGTNGRYIQSVTNLHEWTTPLVSGNPAANKPAQVALVATLTTGADRGLACRGRIFLPTPAANVGADGRITPADATAAANEVAGLLTTLNGITAYGTTSIYSDVREGAVRPVTGVQVGRVLDTMRSRRTSLNEEKPPAVAVGGT